MSDGTEPPEPCGNSDVRGAAAALGCGLGGADGAGEGRRGGADDRDQ